MGDFFHGWRRKIGVATLLMALAFASLWVRGFFIVESFDSYGWVQTFPRLIIENGWYELLTLHSSPETTPVIWPNAMRVWIKRDGGTWFIVAIPHWTVTVPLTLLSAYLLLSQPRVAKPPESTKPPDEPKVNHA